MPMSAMFAVVVFASAAAAEPTFDLVIRNGRVVDGTGNPWFKADVAVRDGRIALVGRVPAGAGKVELDAAGQVVAPGFIDIHSHSDVELLEDGDGHSKIRQGVTTEVLGESTSMGPFKGKVAARTFPLGEGRVTIATLADYFDALKRGRTSVNVATYVGSGTVWKCVMGDSFDRPTAQQLQLMRELIDESMRDGAFGLSGMLAMPPGSLMTADDLVELCKPVAAHGGILSLHIRNEGTGVFDSVREAIGVAERAGVALDIIHLKIADEKLWGRMDEVIALIEAARRRGVQVQANVYPYTRGNNNLASIVPPWAHEGGTEAMLGRLKDPVQRAKIKRDIVDGLPGWYNHYTALGGDWSRMLISDRNSFSGFTMDKVLADRAKGKNPPPDPVEDFLDFLYENRGSVGTVYAHHTEKDMTLAMRQPWCSIGSDGSAYAASGPLRRGHPHPRNFGTFARVPAVYVREQKVLTLEDAVRKMTSLNAAKIGLRDRGLVREGMWADLVVFDPEAIKDWSTYTEPFQYCTGIRAVIVNGVQVLDRDKHTGARPGVPLRRGK